MNAILAVNNRNFIGLDDHLPWKRHKGDLGLFKQLTKGKKLLVGRKTWEGLPGHKLPFAGKLLVVGQGHMTLEQALDESPDWVIGGKQIYEATLQYCENIYVSVINDSTEGNVLCPDLAPYKGKIIQFHFPTDDEVLNFTSSICRIENRLGCRECHCPGGKCTANCRWAYEPTYPGAWLDYEVSINRWTGLEESWRLLDTEINRSQLDDQTQEHL